MKHTLIWITCLLPALALGDERKFSIIPSNTLGLRNGGIFRDTKWSADSEWFYRPAPVCVAEGKRTDFTRFHELAKEYGMQPVWNDRIEKEFGPKTEGGFFYKRPKQDNVIRVANANPATGRFMFKVARYFSHDGYDNEWVPRVKPLPSKEECMVIARNWMKKLNIDEDELYRQGKDPCGFDVIFRIDYIGGTDLATKEPKEWNYGMTLSFAQQVGGLSTWWHGSGGTLICEIGDGGEFCAMYGTLRPWKKIGDYPVLNREELEAALKDGFFWSDEAFRCETVEIVKVDLEVYQAIDSVRQKDFPLVYVLYCIMRGGEANGREVNIRIPALKQHRDRYGEAPKFKPEWIQPEMKPAVEPEAPADVPKDAF